MNLQQIKNTTVKTNNEASNVKHQHSIKKTDISNDFISKAVFVDESGVSKRSNLSGDIRDSIKDISNFTSVSKKLNEQLNILDKIKDTATLLKDNTLTQNDAQPIIAQLISQYDTSINSIKEQVSKLKDLDGDSTTYFDGMAGAIPIDINKLENETGVKQKEINNSLSKTNELITISRKNTERAITEEVKETQKSSPFKEMNFGRESAHFSNQNITSVMGSIASSQANASQAQNIRLLS